MQHTEHVYRVYVTTFLGFGGNFARQRYEDLVLNETLSQNRYIGHEICASDMVYHQVADIKKIYSYPAEIHSCFLLFPDHPCQWVASVKDSPLVISLNLGENVFSSLLPKCIKK